MKRTSTSCGTDLPRLDKSECPEWGQRIDNDLIMSLPVLYDHDQCRSYKGKHLIGTCDISEAKKPLNIALESFIYIIEALFIYSFYE